LADGGQPITVGLGTQVAYGIGDCASGFEIAALNTLALFYYNQVLGLDAMLASLAVMLGVIVEVASDIPVGYFSDRLRTSWGRRHPFIYGAAVPFGCTFFALFSPPQTLNGLTLGAWMFTWMSLSRVVRSIYNVPHLALGAELSTDFHTRTRIAAVRTFFVSASAMAFFLTNKFIFHPTAQFPNAQLNPAYYPTIGLIFGSASIVLILASAVGTHHVIPMLPQESMAATPTTSRPHTFWRQVMRVTMFPPLARLLAALLLWVIALAVARAMDLYLATYFWRLPSSSVFYLPFVSFAALGAGTVIWPAVCRRLGKRTTFVAAAVGFALFSLIPCVAQVAGLFPKASTPLYLAAVIAVSFLAGLCCGAIYVVAPSTLADVVDEYESASGLRRAGILFGGLSVASKLGSGIGTSVAGAIVAWLALKRGMAPSAVPATTAAHLGLTAGLVIAVLALGAAAVGAGYSIDERRHATLRAALDGKTRT
jgi:Na+/melibiose symporter-like transporter